MEGWAEKRKHYVGAQAVFGANYTTLSPASAAGTCTVQEPLPKCHSDQQTDCDNRVNKNPKLPGSKGEFELRITSTLGNKFDVRLIVRGPCYGRDRTADGLIIEGSIAGSPYKLYHRGEPARPLKQSHKVWLDPGLTSHDIEVQCKDEVVVTSNGSPGMANEDDSILAMDGTSHVAVRYVSSVCPMIVGDVSPIDILESTKDYTEVFATIFACVLLCLCGGVSVLIIGCAQLHFRG